MSVTALHGAEHRADIDGLRALAVIPVLLFHAEIPGFTGGYVGVDVFFVISGYLITRIILRDLSAGRFSMAMFLERRVRRILPALYVVMAACILPAWFLMLAADFENFGQSLFATAVSANNVLLWLTSGYWGIASEFKPLLHTWSLGVEEQFYLVYPLLLLVLFRRPRPVTATVMVLAWVASLLSAQWLLAEAPSAVFLLLPFRTFELLTGGFLAWLETAHPGLEGRACGRLASPLCWAGLVAIGFSVAMFDGNSAVPGYTALLPVGGAAAILACGNAPSAANKLLSFRPAVWVGAISYSLYLWHQPLLAFLRIVSPEPPSKLALLSVVGLSVPLAWASWRWVEQPFRNRQRLSRGVLFVTAAAVGVLFGGFGLLIDSQDGFPGRVPGLAPDGGGGRRVTREMYVDRIFSYLDRPFSDQGKPHVLVLGNSFARDFINCAIENGYMRGAETCYLPVNNRGDFGCFGDGDAVSPQIRARLAGADIVILVQGDVPTFDTACWDADLALLRAAGARRVILVGTKDFGWNPNAIMCMGDEDRLAFRPRVRDEVFGWNEQDRRNVPADSFVDMLGMLADEGRTVPLFTPGGELISEDGRHFTKPGAKFVGELLFAHPALKDLR